MTMWRHQREAFLIRLRTGTLLFALLAAPPLWAHGEQLLVAFGVVLYGLPAVALLVLPWHRWWARLTSVAVLVLGTLFLWSQVPAQLQGRTMSALVQWSILLSPTIAALLVAVVLRVLVKRKVGPAA